MWVNIVDSFLFTVLYPVTLIFAVLLGYFISRNFYIRKNVDWKASGIEASVIAIFSLLLSFTFLSSNNSMKDRLKLLHETSDATANLRRQSLLMDNDIKDTTRVYLINYLDVLGNFREHYINGETNVIEEIENINGKYLDFLTAKSKTNAESKQQVLLLIPHFSNLNSLFYHIVYSYKERTPHLIIILLIVSSWLISLLVGFMNGFHSKRHYLVPFIFIVIVTLFIQTIRDLDNPENGTIQPQFTDFRNQFHILVKSTR